MRARRWAMGAGLALVVTFGSTGTGGAQSLPDLDLTQPPKALCGTVFTPGAFEGFSAESEVAAGEPISIAVEWLPSNVAADTVDLLGCVAVDGKAAEGLATLGRKVDNDGQHHLSFLLPDDLALGSKVCERSAVIGARGDITRTPATCFSVASAEPEVAASPPARQSAAAPGKTVTVPAPAAPAPAVAPAPAESKNVQPAAGPPAPEVAGATEEKSAVAPDTLARTGSGARPLGVLAGMAIVLGGLAVALGGPRLAAGRARR